MLKFNSLENINVFIRAAKFTHFCAELGIKLCRPYLCLAEFLKCIIDRKRYASIGN